MEWQIEDLDSKQGCVARVFSCGEADDDALPAHGESRTTSER